MEPSGPVQACNGIAFPFKPKYRPKKKNIVHHLKHKINFIFDVCWAPSQCQILLQSFSEKHFHEMASAFVIHIGINLWVRKKNVPHNPSCTYNAPHIKLAIIYYYYKDPSRVFEYPPR